ncbi:hypothetical protein D3C87_1491000 [compost metagenome]
MMMMAPPMNSWDSPSMGMLTANTVFRRDTSSSSEPHCSMRIGPMLSMSWPAGMAMTMGRSALRVTMKPISRVDAPSSEA